MPKERSKNRASNRIPFSHLVQLMAACIGGAALILAALITSWREIWSCDHPPEIAFLTAGLLGEDSVDKLMIFKLEGETKYLTHKLIVKSSKQIVQQTATYVVEISVESSGYVLVDARNVVEVSGVEQEFTRPQVGCKIKATFLFDEVFTEKGLGGILLKFHDLGDYECDYLDFRDWIRYRG